MMGRLAGSMRNDAMSIRRLAGHDVGLNADCGQLEEDDSQHLIQVLRELLDRLLGENHSASVSITEEVERWEDGEYHYLETTLPNSASAEIDVNIQMGRACIRVAR